MKRQNQLNIKRGLLSKLVLLVALFLGSSNAWGDELTVYNSTSSSDYIVPIGGKYLNTNNFKCEFIIPKSELTAMAGKQITKMTFFIKTASNNSWGDASFQVFLKEVDFVELTSLTGKTGATVVYEGGLDATGSTMEIPFTSSNFDYVNDNLLVGIYCTTAGTPSTNDPYFYGQSFAGSIDYNTAAFYTTYSGNRKFIPKTKFDYESAETYKRPKNLRVETFDGSSATLKWDKGDNEEKWIIKYSTKEDFDPKTEGISITASDITYKIEGLMEQITYYAYVCANYDGIYSEYSNKLSFTINANITINEDASNTNSNIPIIDRTYSENLMLSQFIIPNSELNSIKNHTITGLTFYSSQTSIDWNGAKFEVYLNETDNLKYNNSTKEFEDWGQKVIDSKELSVTGKQLTLTFDHNYNYKSGNLVVGFKQTSQSEGSSSINSTWYGVNQTPYDNYTAIYYGQGYSSPGTFLVTFIPKVHFSVVASTVPVTLDGNDYTTFACPRPLDLTTTKMPEGLKAYKAEVDAENGKVIFTDINQKVAANTGILLAGTAGETYNIPVADSGDPVGDNAFLVNSTGGTFAAEGDYTYFGFKKNSEPITFATFNPSTVAIPTNKAYLKVLTKDLPTEAHQLVALFDDGETTSLREIRNEELGIKNAVFFNLNGQRVAQPTKGLYIVNGKKVLVP